MSEINFTNPSYGNDPLGEDDPCPSPKYDFGPAAAARYPPRIDTTNAALQTPPASPRTIENGAVEYTRLTQSIKSKAIETTVTTSLIEISSPLENSSALRESTTIENIEIISSEKELWQGTDAEGSTTDLTLPSTPNHEPLKCELCEKPGPDCKTCNLCQVVFCEPCWPKFPAHKPGRKGLKGVRAQIHEKIDPVVEEKLERILDPHIEEKEQQELLSKDEYTAWFAVFKDEWADLIFQDLGRYGNVVSGFHKKAYPSLVSFVGPTGSGKSTVIRMLMELDYSDNLNETPVVKSALCFSTLPTSGDVHLFCDPHTCQPNATRPILYADCEGLEGGERTPLGSRTLKREKLREVLTPIIPGLKEDPNQSQRQDTSSSFSRPNRITQQSSERELKWAKDEKTKKREFVVSELYPRILYTFSDVVVFVLREVNKLESVIERLIIWATAALEKASNQPVLPYAIIVMNSLPNDTPESFWDIDATTKTVMDEIDDGFFQNPTFIPYIKHWQGLGVNVRSASDLLSCYYDHLKVVRIPRKGRSNLIKQQVSQLYKEINVGIKHSYKLKRERRMLMSASNLQVQLQSAYDHFAESLGTAFDFVKSTFAHNPIPSDFGGSILKLILSVKNHTKKDRDGKFILQSVAPVIASCILLDATRQQIPGTAAAIFPQYSLSCNDAFNDFLDKHLECSVRCVNYRVGHKTKGHQDKNGKIIATGDYVATVKPEYINNFRNLILSSLKSMERGEEKGAIGSEVDIKEELPSVAIAHRDKYMVPFYESFGGSGDFVSHTACLICLFHSPEHHLKCGHIICTPCLQTYGIPQGGIVSIASCPMHPKDQKFWPSQMFAVKPPSAGVRVLSLDGGGVRGLSQLIFLQSLENALGFELQLTSFFDLIVGTSTGGYTALGLVGRDWTIPECIQNFKKLCKKAFAVRRWGSLPGLQHLIGGNGYKYRTHYLQRALMEVFHTNDYLFGGIKKASKPVPKVAVTTASSAGKAIVLGNYNHVNHGEASYDFPRSEIPENEFKIWEAARATGATPGYLKEFSHVASKDVYLDGGIHHNNPIFVAESERKLIWPEVDHLPPDIVLSLGSGFNPNAATIRESRKERKFRTRGAHARTLEKLHWLATDPIESSMGSEETWETWLKYNSLDVGPITGPDSTKRAENRYIRWCARFDGLNDPPHLDDLDSLQRIESETYKQVQEFDIHIKSIADHLICSTFYFELHETTESRDTNGHVKSIHVKGSINCRLGPHTPDICKLGKLFQSLNTMRNLNPSWKPYFTIREISPYAGNLPVGPIYITETAIQQMTDMKSSKFELPEIEFDVPSRDTVLEISLRLDSSSEFPISGFPCPILLNVPNGIALKNAFLRRARVHRSALPGSSKSSLDLRRELSEVTLHSNDTKIVGSKEC
ncbi:hypothetical protein TWF481_002199 [Arthrobotrys musiformis]|uniref:PNPLA domain-containing protein n=1 Tax=Arthrobotrys musiformis TaxID=47236 RepID=A0AAV9VSI4_9PEZI